MRLATDDTDGVTAGVKSAAVMEEEEIHEEEQDACSKAMETSQMQLLCVRSQGFGSPVAGASMSTLCATSSGGEPTAKWR